MKNITPSNPLKTFNDNKALAVKKMGGAQTSFKKSLPKAQVGQSIKTWNIGDQTPSGQVVKTQKDIENLNKMERINSYGRPVDKYTNPPILSKPKTIVPIQKVGGATKALPKAQLGAIINGISRLKKIYNMYNTGKQSSKLGKLPSAQKVKKGVVTKVMSKSFNAIKNKKK